MRKTLALVVALPGLFVAGAAMAHPSSIPHTHVDGFTLSLLLPVGLLLGLIGLSAMALPRLKPRKVKIQDQKRK